MSAVGSRVHNKIAASVTIPMGTAWHSPNGWFLAQLEWPRTPNGPPKAGLDGWCFRQPVHDPIQTLPPNFVYKASMGYGRDVRVLDAGSSREP